MSFYDDGTVPDNYRCAKCGAHGAKLWRQYQAFLEQIYLLCGSCALADQKCAGPIDAEGRRAEDVGGSTDQIGWLVPAVPDEKNETFWGYSSVPDAGVRWWRALPTTVTR
jgi:hypothetical protein